MKRVDKLEQEDRDLNADDITKNDACRLQLLGYCPLIGKRRGGIVIERRPWTSKHSDIQTSKHSDVQTFRHLDLSI